MGETTTVKGETEQQEVRPKEKERNAVPRIEVIEDFCKGCEICVVMCPKNVLEMRPDPTRWVGAIVKVVRPEDCTRCMLCEVHCPDFAIKVY